MNRLTLSFLLVVLLSTAALAGIGSHDAMYVGGTVPDLKEKTEGKPVLSDDKAFIFKYKGGDLKIPYQQIDSLEYGQKAGRRVGVAIVITVWALFSKKRKHFLTVGYTDKDNKPQGLVLEIPKGRAKSVITIIEARSGKKVEYESKEAKEHVHG